MSEIYKAEQVKSRNVQVRETGEPTIVRDSDHAHANHYITMSQKFFPNTRLRTYMDGRYLLSASIGLCCASVLGFLGLLMDAKGIPIVFTYVCLAIFFIYCQHEWVNQKSLPLVLKQPVLEGQQYGNKIYEVTITELHGIALENYQAGIGFVQLTQGKIEIQAFSPVAVQRMYRARSRSRLMLAFSFLTTGWNILFSILANARWS